MKLLFTAFVDVSPEETDQKSPFKEEATDTDVSKSAQPPVEVSFFFFFFFFFFKTPPPPPPPPGCIRPT